MEETTNTGDVQMNDVAEETSAPADAGQERELEREFEQLIKGRYADAYGKRTQQMINRRFRETKELEAFRDRMRRACPGCDKKELCMGGCPLMPEIVFCDDDKRHIQGGE